MKGILMPFLLGYLWDINGIFIGLNGIFLRYFHGKIIEIFTVEWDLFIFVHWIIGCDQIQWESFRQQYMMLVAELLRYTSNILGILYQPSNVGVSYLQTQI